MELPIPTVCVPVSTVPRPTIIPLLRGASVTLTIPTVVITTVVTGASPTLNVPLVCVCIPCYNGALWVESAIQSIESQTHKNWEVIISVDKGTDDSATICKKYETRSNFRIFYQNQRLGWVRNCNLLLSKAEGDYVFILPCDDLIDDNYIEGLLDTFAKNPKAVVCYPKIKCFGEQTHEISQKSITYPNPLMRIWDVIKKHLAGVSFRGLIDRRKIARTPYLYYLNTEHYNDMLADSTWILQQAIVGELHENPEVIYYKRYHKSNEHIGWTKKSSQDKLVGWARHCSLLFGIVVRFFPGQSQDILSCCKMRYQKMRYDNLTLEQVSANMRILMNEFHLHFPHSANSLVMLKDKSLTPHHKKAIVLGAGLQGCCVALMLSKYGFKVSIIDQCGDIMTRASMNQEGKIHLGFVYSLDKSGKTSDTVLEGALNFAHYMEYLLEEKLDWETLKSEPFTYLVPTSSLLDSKEIEKCFESIQKKYEELLSLYPHLSYLGQRPLQLFKRTEMPEKVDHDFFSDCFQTEEVALSQRALKEKIRKALDRKGIELIFNKRVELVKRSSCTPSSTQSSIQSSIQSSTSSAQRGFEVITGPFMTSQVTDTATTRKTETIETDIGRMTRGRGIRLGHAKTSSVVYQSDLIFNCFWEGRSLIDKKLGLEVNANNNIRLKFGIESDYLDSLIGIPSCTIVQGPFGDFVRFQNEKRMYFSWYPASMRGMIVGSDIPREWNDYGSSIIPDDLKRDLISSNGEKFQQLFKTKFDFVNPVVVGGMIVANGTKDIKYSDSELHSRSHMVVTKDRDDYYSISTNKFTSAPLNTLTLERQFVQRLATRI